ncbi:hypothetical protein [Ferdinandcohnia sp. Marseille-Q9671]
MYYYDPNGLTPYSQTPYHTDSYYDLENNRQLGSFPFFPPQGGGQMGPPNQGPGAGPPSAPPPSYVPTQSFQQSQAFAVDPGSIRSCLFRYTYVWMRGNRQFWFYPTFVGRRSVSGYRWTGFRWVYFGTSLRQIQSFTCI